MNQQTLTISVELYERLVAEAQLRGAPLNNCLKNGSGKILRSDADRKPDSGLMRYSSGWPPSTA
jgi:hypothetical protein